MAKNIQFSLKRQIRKQIKATSDISIVGSGVIGQATGMGFAIHGLNVLFHDIDEKKLLLLMRKGYEVTTEILEALSTSDVLFVCVPTPTIDARIDVSFVQNVAASIGKIIGKLGRYVVVVFRSTILPKTTRCELIPILEKHSGLKAGKDFGVCMNPEFLREQSALEDFLNPSRIIIGELDQRSGDTLSKVYSIFNCPVIRTDLDTAEMIKYTSNLFLASKISYFNEVFLICKKLGLNPKQVSEAVSLDPRIGQYGIYGGKPFGGVCLPKDLAAFITFAKSKGFNPKLLSAVSDINKEIALYDSRLKS